MKSMKTSVAGCDHPGVNNKGSSTRLELTATPSWFDREEKQTGNMLKKISFFELGSKSFTVLKFIGFVPFRCVPCVPTAGQATQSSIITRSHWSIFAGLVWTLATTATFVKMALALLHLDLSRGNVKGIEPMDTR